jgi:pimeloyl-ACP methyl ester carboxylesterase
MHGHGDVDAIIAGIGRSWGPALFAGVLDRSFATPLPPAERSAFLRYAERVDPRAAEGVLSSQRDLDLADRLHELTVPVAVVHGTADSTRTVDQVAAFAGLIPGARLHLLACGHSPMFELPEEVAAIVRTTLRA